MTPASLRHRDLRLLARLRALVRRGRGALGPPREVIRVGELELSPRDGSAKLAGRPLGLNTTEFVLLRVLAERAGRVLHEVAAPAEGLHVGTAVYRWGRSSSSS